jgi:hypothetical protein
LPLAQLPTLVQQRQQRQEREVRRRTASLQLHWAVAL